MTWSFQDLAVGHPQRNAWLQLHRALDLPELPGLKGAVTFEEYSEVQGFRVRVEVGDGKSRGRVFKFWDATGAGVTACAERFVGAA